jgi:hypothetical protein
VSAKLHARARVVRERAQVLAWEFRQRRHSKGVWFRLRRALVDAESAWRLEPQDAERLREAGHVPLAVGLEFEPPKQIFFVSREELLQLETRTAVSLGLRAELLAAEHLALVRDSRAP